MRALLQTAPGQPSNLHAKRFHTDTQEEAQKCSVDGERKKWRRHVVGQIHKRRGLSVDGRCVFADSAFFQHALPAASAVSSSGHTSCSTHTRHHSPAPVRHNAQQQQQAAPRITSGTGRESGHPVQKQHQRLAVLLTYNQFRPHQTGSYQFRYTLLPIFG